MRANKRVIEKVTQAEKSKQNRSSVLEKEIKKSIFSWGQNNYTDKTILEIVPHDQGSNQM